MSHHRQQINALVILLASRFVSAGDPDCSVAAECAVCQEATLWTRNPGNINNPAPTLIYLVHLVLHSSGQDRIAHHVASWLQ